MMQDKAVSYHTTSLLSSARSLALKSVGAIFDYQIPIIIAASAVEAYFNELADFARRFRVADEPQAVVVLSELLADLERQTLRFGLNSWLHISLSPAAPLIRVLSRIKTSYCSSNFATHLYMQNRSHSH